MRRCPSNPQREEMRRRMIERRTLDPKSFKVGVFPFDARNTRFNAYTSWYNQSWSGCCEHTVEAANGTEAKKIAIQEHKESTN